MLRIRPFISFSILLFLIIAIIMFVRNDEIDNPASKAMSPIEIEGSETAPNEKFETAPPTELDTTKQKTQIPAITTVIPTMISSPEQPQEEALYQASLQFISHTREEADQIAKKIDYMAGDSESASNLCGPLTIAILNEAGHFEPKEDPHHAWLLCARENREECYGMEILNKIYFPPDEYEYIRVYESVRDYDFKSNPLQPGDWMYLFTYIHGYDHMLLVTRVDDKGNPYTVTNIDWGEGFIISEMKLYDNEDPEKGLFYELTKIERRRIGMMGTAGFLLVRKTDG